MKVQVDPNAPWRCPLNAPLVTFLRQVPVLAGLDEQAYGLLATLVRTENYNSGEVIVRQGEAGNRMFMLVSGGVEVVRTAADRPVVLARFGPGEFFGEMSLVESRTRSADVRAVEAVQACTLRGTDLLRLYHDYPAQYGIVVLNLARDLARRLRALDERFCDVAH